MTIMSSSQECHCFGELAGMRELYHNMLVENCQIGTCLVWLCSNHMEHDFKFRIV